MAGYVAGAEYVPSTKVTLGAAGAPIQSPIEPMGCGGNSSATGGASGSPVQSPGQYPVTGGGAAGGASGTGYDPEPVGGGCHGGAGGGQVWPTPPYQPPIEPQPWPPVEQYPTYPAPVPNPGKPVPNPDPDPDDPVKGGGPIEPELVLGEVKIDEVAYGDFWTPDIPDVINLESSGGLKLNLMARDGKAMFYDSTSNRWSTLGRQHGAVQLEDGTTVEWRVEDRNWSLFDPGHDRLHFTVRPQGDEDQAVSITTDDGTDVGATDLALSGDQLRELVAKLEANVPQEGDIIGGGGGEELLTVPQVTVDEIVSSDGLAVTWRDEVSFTSTNGYELRMRADQNGHIQTWNSTSQFWADLENPHEAIVLADGTKLEWRYDKEGAFIPTADKHHMTLVITPQGDPAQEVAIRTEDDIDLAPTQLLLTDTQLREMAEIMQGRLR